MQDSRGNLATVSVTSTPRSALATRRPYVDDDAHAEWEIL